MAQTVVSEDGPHCAYAPNRSSRLADRPRSQTASPNDFRCDMSPSQECHDGESSRCNPTDLGPERSPDQPKRYQRHVDLIASLVMVLILRSRPQGHDCVNWAQATNNAMIPLKAFRHHEKAQGRRGDLGVRLAQPASGWPRRCAPRDDGRNLCTPATLFCKNRNLVLCFSPWQILGGRPLRR